MPSITEIQLEIEARCLLNCKHCSSMPVIGIDNIGYKLTDVNRFIKLIDAPVHLYLTGGEPLLQPKLIDIISQLYVNNSETSIGIFTSGIVQKDRGFSSISAELASELSRAGLYCAYVSVYHIDPVYHDGVTNFPGALDYVMQTINNLVATGVIVKIHLVLNRHNIHSLEHIITQLTTAGVSEIRLLRLVKIGNAINHWNDIGISYEMQNDAISNIFRIRNEFKCTLTFSGFPEMVECRPFNNSNKCQAGTKLFYVTFGGDIFPCACVRGNLQHKIAHISETAKIQEYLCSVNYKIHEECLNSQK